MSAAIASRSADERPQSYRGISPVGVLWGSPVGVL